MDIDPPEFAFEYVLLIDSSIPNSHFCNNTYRPGHSIYDVVPEMNEDSIVEDAMDLDPPEFALEWVLMFVIILLKKQLILEHHRRPGHSIYDATAVVKPEEQLFCVNDSSSDEESQVSALEYVTSLLNFWLMTLTFHPV